MKLDDLRAADRAAFCNRLSNVIKLLADEGIELNLPFIVLDHVAIHDFHLQQILAKVRRCASNGHQIENDGLKLFKIKEFMAVKVKDSLETVTKVWMIVINCLELEEYHALFKIYNQSRAYQQTISAYAFDIEGCKYPDEFETTTPLNMRSMRATVRYRRNPVLIDHQSAYRNPTRDRRKTDKSESGCPLNILRRDVTMPTYMPSRPTTPCSLGYISHLSDDKTSQYSDRRRVIDVTNSPTKRINSAKPQGNSNQHYPSRHPSPKDSTRGRNNQWDSKENATAQKRQADRDQSSHGKLIVHDRLGEPKRFKPNEVKAAECSHGREGTGEKQRPYNNRGDRKARYNNERSEQRS